MFHFDSLSQISLAAYALLTLITLLSAPRQDLRDKRDLILVVFGNLLAYSARSEWLFAAGWGLTIAPFFLHREVYSLGVRIVHGVSLLALILGLATGSQNAGIVLVIVVGQRRQVQRIDGRAGVHREHSVKRAARCGHRYGSAVRRSPAIPNGLAAEDAVR